MKRVFCAVVAAGLWSAASAQTEEVAMTCEQLQENYTISSSANQLTQDPNLFGACEEVVMRDGAPFIKVKAVVRRPGTNTVRLYVPATDRTVEITPPEGLRVMIDGRKVRTNRLERGQEIRIYLSVEEFTKPKAQPAQQVAMVTETEEIVEVTAVPVAALPTTASSLPAVGLFGGLLLAGGLLLRRLRSA